MQSEPVKIKKNWTSRVKPFSVADCPMVILRKKRSFVSITAHSMQYMFMLHLSMTLRTYLYLTELIHYQTRLEFSERLQPAFYKMLSLRHQISANVRAAAQATNDIFLHIYCDAMHYGVLTPMISFQSRNTCQDQPYCTGHAHTAVTMSDSSLFLTITSSMSWPHFTFICCKGLIVLVYFYFPLSLHHYCCISNEKKPDVMIWRQKYWFFS